MELFKPSNMEVWTKYFQIDEYDADVQREAYEDLFKAGNPLYDFIMRNIKKGKILDIGCAGGMSFKSFPITDGLEPSDVRFKQALSFLNSSSIFKAVAECIPHEDKVFNTVLSIGVLEHCRSDFEALLEINRVLKTGGVFIMEFGEARFKTPFAPTGRTYNADHLVLRFEDYGFSLVEKRYFDSWSCLAFEKVKDFDVKDFLKVQYVKVGDLYKINNMVVPKW